MASEGGIVSQGEANSTGMPLSQKGKQSRVTNLSLNKQRV